MVFCIFAIGSPDVWFFFFSSRRRHTRCGRDWSSDVCSSDLAGQPVRLPGVQGGERVRPLQQQAQLAGGEHPGQRPGRVARSEEHTSELQSRPHLVCRLLLEKKKYKQLDSYVETRSPIFAS